MSDESNGAKGSQKPDDKLKELAYRDMARPAARQFGKDVKPAGANLARAVVTTTEVIDMLATGMKRTVVAMGDAGTYLAEQIKERFTDKPERLVPPSPTVAVPALEAMRYAVEEPSLRDMYVKLLETAMDSDTSEDAHPAYVEIIKQLTPDEARILEELRKHESFVIYNVSAHFQGELRRDYRIILEAGSILTPTSTYKKFMMIPTYLENLERLQLATSWPTGPNRATPHLGRTYPRNYPELERLLTETKEHVFYNWVRTINNVMQNNECDLYGLTPFGRKFCQACVGTIN